MCRESHSLCLKQKCFYIALFLIAIILSYTTVLFADSITLRWDPPTKNSDETPLVDLGGYIINYGTTSGSYSNSKKITDKNITIYAIENLNSNASYYFSVVAYDLAGNKSGPSNRVIVTMNDKDGDRYLAFVDCDDNDNTVNPGAVEICDGIDNNCDNTIDEGFDNDGDSYKTCSGDCNDNNYMINPETYWHQDNDGDRFGTRSIFVQQCRRPEWPISYTLNHNDYDDNNINIGAPIMIDGARPFYFSSLQAAYKAAFHGKTIKVIDVLLIGNLYINKSKAVTFSGGYDGSFSTISGASILQGDIIISNGTLIMENFIVE